MSLEWLGEFVHDVEGFPKPGVLFKDISPLLADPDALRFAVEAMAEPYVGGDVAHVAGIDARGFIVGAAVAYRLGCGFVPIRKAGKLPRATVSCSYELEYGTNTLEMHTDAFAPGERVVLVDDVLATGGTAAASLELIAQTGADVAGVAFLIELGFLDGRKRLGTHDPHVLLSYD